MLVVTGLFWCAVAGEAAANPVLTLITQLVMARIDSNGDGRVTRAELATAERDRFSQADTNHDRLISPEEFHTAYLAEVGQLGSPWADQVFQVIDRDADGLLSFDEVAAAGENIFRVADRNHDGFITAQELTPQSVLAP